MLTKDIHGLTVNTEKCYEIQVRIVYVSKKLFFGSEIKKSKDWSHWKYYKTMAGMLDALRHFKLQIYSTLIKNSEFKWDFRATHKYYDIEKK